MRFGVEHNIPDRFQGFVWVDWTLRVQGPNRIHGKAKFVVVLKRAKNFAQHLFAGHRRFDWCTLPDILQSTRFI